MPLGSPVHTHTRDRVADLVLDDPTVDDTVYRPQDDSFLLVEAALAQAAQIRGGRVLDLCCGSGVIGIAAARLGAGEVVAVDTNPHAVRCTAINADRAGVRVRALCGSLTEAGELGPFDVVLSNPPYVPTPPDGVRRLLGARADVEPQAAHAWDAGHDGRGVLDSLCATLPELLAPAGVALIVHSEAAGIDTTVASLTAHGLAADVVAQARIVLGPVMSERAKWLTGRGLLPPNAATELLAVVRGRR